MPNTTLLYTVAAFVYFMIGLSKGGLGGTLGTLATPLLALILPPEDVVGLLLPVLIFTDVFAVAAHWGHWQRRLVVLLIPGAIAGVIIGTLFITNTPTETLRLVLGVIVLFFITYKLLEGRFQTRGGYQSRAWHGGLAGTVAGFSSALAHTGGPPISVYLLLQELQPRVFVATSALFFAVLNWIKVPFYFYAGLFDWELFWSLAFLLPVLPLGVWVGRRFGERVPKLVFDRIILVLLAAAAILLIFG